MAPERTAEGGRQRRGRARNPSTDSTTTTAFPEPASPPQPPSPPRVRASSMDSQTLPERSRHDYAARSLRRRRSAAQVPVVLAPVDVPDDAEGRVEFYVVRAPRDRDPEPPVTPDGIAPAELGPVEAALRAAEAALAEATAAAGPAAQAAADAAAGSTGLEAGASEVRAGESSAAETGGASPDEQASPPVVSSSPTPATEAPGPPVLPLETAPDAPGSAGGVPDVAPPADAQDSAPPAAAPASAPPADAQELTPPAEAQELAPPAEAQGSAPPADGQELATGPSAPLPPPRDLLTLGSGWVAVGILAVVLAALFAVLDLLLH